MVGGRCGRYLASVARSYRAASHKYWQVLS